MSLVGIKEHHKANRRWRRLRKNKTLQQAIAENTGSYNIIGQGGAFVVGKIYHVTWMVGGKAVGNAFVTIPPDECKSMTATDWFNQYVQTIMFGFDISHADLIVSEVVDDTKTLS